MHGEKLHVQEGAQPTERVQRKKKRPKCLTTLELNESNEIVSNNTTAVFRVYPKSKETKIHALLRFHASSAEAAEFSYSVIFCSIIFLSFLRRSSK